MATGHIALLGDSIFDNGRYTAGQPDVLGHLRSLLPGSWKATLLARDGSRTCELGEQVARLPREATHLVVSIGGNDLLAVSDLLATPVPSTTAALKLFADRSDQFERSYRAALEPLLSFGRDVTVCTVYNGNLPQPQAEVARVALSVFNDAILRFAFERALQVIELRAVCSEPADYANPLEPSGRGGLKIARVIVQAVGAMPPPSLGVARVVVPR
ncbi:MAG: SGNH/GDSL hydrolase family protein [Deltaproteobacteria bacterium]|nr:SGNH/GDSL hydrolase family protein [Deltaproteobacteria bacterium]